MKIGYSAWGFIGDGLIDSPDGGRLTRSLMISQLLFKDVEIVWLQKNRDVNDNGEPLFSTKTKNNYKTIEKRILCNIEYDDAFPQIDVLFLEWRWRLPGRNCDVDVNSKNYTPDLDRQNKLLDHYLKTDTKIMIWDKDETMTLDDELYIGNNTKNSENIIVFSPALYPIKKLFTRTTLLFPCDLTKIRGTKINETFTYHIGYVGSQYERDEQVYKYINPVAEKYDVVFVGNWLKYPGKAKRNKVNFPLITFRKRILPKHIHKIYRDCLSTVLLCKKNYAEHGHITQRIHECISNGSLAIGLKEQKGIKNFIPEKLIVSDAYDLVNCIEQLLNMNIKEKQKLLDEEIENLRPFDVNNVLETLESKFE